MSKNRQINIGVSEDTRLRIISFYLSTTQDTKHKKRLDTIDGVINRALDALEAKKIE